MGRGGSKDKQAKDFIAGRTNKAKLSVQPGKALGYSPVQATASGAGAHGGGKRRRNRRERQAARQRLRRGEWD